MQLTDPDALRLTRADVSLNLGGARMRIAATPYYGGFRVQPLDGYTDLTGALSLVSPLMDAATAKTATFDVALSGPLSLSGTATVTKTSGGYDAALTTVVDGVTIRAEYIGGTCCCSPTNEAMQSRTSSSVTVTGASAVTVPLMSCVSVAIPRLSLIHI